MLHCTVLNATHEPLGFVPVRKGLRLVLEGKAFLLELHPERLIRTVGREFPAPSSVVLKRFCKTGPKYYGTAALNQRNLWARDGYACVYCHRSLHELRGGEQLSRDHVLPTSKRGQDTWDNVVTACSRCNHQKDDRSLDEIRSLILGLEQELFEALPAPEELPEPVREGYAAALAAHDYAQALTFLPQAVGERKQVKRLLRDIATWSKFVIPVPQKIPTVFEIITQRKKYARRGRHDGI